jgi:hypothetical protein
MAIPVVEGFRIGGNTPIDDRLVYSTVAQVFLPPDEGGIGPLRRYDGLAVWITSENKLYRFIGGTTEAHFVVDTATTAVIETIIQAIQEHYLATFFNSETIENLTTLLMESDAFKNAFWSKTELRVMSQSEYTAAAPGSIPADTVVMIKESV